jgi:hypothetical protein
MYGRSVTTIRKHDVAGEPEGARRARWHAADVATLVAAACYGAAMLVVAVGLLVRLASQL